jgi:hypothetical protein
MTLLPSISDEKWLCFLCTDLETEKGTETLDRKALTLCFSVVKAISLFVTKL